MRCEACANTSVRAECVLTPGVPTYGIVLIATVPTAVLVTVTLVMYLWHRYKQDLLRHEVRQDIANFVFHEIRNPMHAIVNTLDVAPQSVHDWERFQVLRGRRLGLVDPPPPREALERLTAGGGGGGYPSSRVGSKNSQTTPPTTSTAPICQLLGSANAETTPAGAPAAAADRTQRPDTTCEGKNG